MGSEEPKPVLLVIDDERHMRRAVRAIARRQGCEVIEAEHGEEGLELLDRHDVTCAFVDQMLPGMLGVDVLRRAVREHPNVAYVLFTSAGDADIGFQAYKLGADYTTKQGGNSEWLLETLHKALLSGKLKRENAALRKHVETSPADRLLLGPSPQMERVRKDVRKYAAMSSQHILVLGESGVGKEVCAKALHAESGRPGRLVTLNAGAISTSLAESELFGHEKGAFTSADRVKVGAFEHAGEGAVFLDEIGDLPLPIQVKLLRVLESGTYSRVGSNEERVFRGRVIAATNHDLDKMIEEGRFRKELRWRFGFTIHLPPLRAHVPDVPILAMRFLMEHCAEIDRSIRNITREAMACLQAYEWRRNNVRELRNVMAEAVASCSGDFIELGDLPEVVRAAGPLQRPQVLHGMQAPTPSPASAAPSGPALGLSLLDVPYKSAKQESVHLFARWYLVEKLVEHGGVVTHAAEASGMKRPNFHRLMKEHLDDAAHEEIELRLAESRVST